MPKRLLDCFDIDDFASMYAIEQMAIKFAAKVFQAEMRVALVFKSGGRHSSIVIVLAGDN